MSLPNVEDVYPLSPLQEGLLFHTLSHPDSGVYVEQVSLSLRGEVQAETLRRAWETVVAERPLLRTAFLWEGLDEPLQVVRERVELPWSEHDWRGLKSSDRRARLEAWFETDRLRGFDLEQAPLARITLFRLSEDEARMVWSFHHILADGWTVPLIFEDLWRTYRDEPLPERRAFRDYVAWREELDTGADLGYWEKLLSGWEGTPLPDHQTGLHGWKQLDQELDAELSRRLQNLAREERLTLNTLFQGAWALVQSRYLGQRDVIHGSTTSGRPPDLDGAETMLGPFINTLPVRVEVETEQPLRDWLTKLQKNLVESQEHQFVPLSEIQAAAGRPGQPLFESLVVFENYPTAQTGELPFEVGVGSFFEQSNYPLALLVVPGAKIKLQLVYDSGRFRRPWIQRTLEHLQQALSSFLEQMTSRLGEISLLTEGERRQLEIWNDTAAEVPQATVLDLFNEQVRDKPQSAALSFQDSSMTYQELDRRANGLAQRLIREGLVPGEAVAICLPRSLEMVVAVLGILKAAGAYVPIDPEQPRERRNQILGDAAVKWVVARHSDEFDHCRVLDPTESLPEDGSLPEPRPDQIAYVLYTSGSTGRPRGVEVEHRSLLHSTAARTLYYRESPQCFLLMSPLAFDSSVAGIFWTLCGGGTLVIPAPRQEQDLEGLLKLVETAKVTHTLCLPTLYGLFLEAAVEQLRSLRTVIVAGESCPRSLVEKHYQSMSAARLYNEYGPTEATVWSTVHLTREGGSGPVPIGGPIANAEVHVLTDDGLPLPVGVPGHLHIGGAGLARGYLGQPELTAERFPELRGKRLYKTGDMAAWGEGGQLLFLGRLDDQIKIRGQRVELGEIECVLLGCPGVREAAVVARKDETTGSVRRVEAFLVLGPEINVSQIREFLITHLPKAMVPDPLVALHQLPRTVSGKVDRKALLRIEERSDESRPERTSSQLPSEAESVLTRIWEEVLDLDWVGPEDSFFEVGGDSILSIQVISRARSAGWDLTPELLFSYPILAELAAKLQKADETRSGAEQGTVEGGAPLTPVQHWFFSQEFAEPHHWNQALWLAPPPDLQKHLLEQALDELVRHHDSLRLQFKEGRQTYAAPEPVELARLEDELSFQSGLDLERARVFRAGLDASGRLLLVAHHLVADALSWATLVEDLNTLYGQLAAGEQPQLPAKTCSFQRWSQTLADFKPDREFWAPHIDGPWPEPPACTEADAERLREAFPKDWTEAFLKRAGGAYNTQPQDLLLVALLRCWRELTGEVSLKVGLESHGREALEGLDVTRTVGWFTIYYHLELRLVGSELDQQVKSVKEQLRSIPDRGVGFGLIHHSASRKPREPIFLVNYLGRGLTLPTGAFFQPVGWAVDTARSPRNRRTHHAELNASVEEGRLELHWTCSPELPGGVHPERFSTKFVESLKRVTEHCLNPDLVGYTPSDFPEVDLDQGELDRLLEGLA